jgi:hypothetical protein
VINDEKREWTDSPNRHESQTQQDHDLVHVTSMRKKCTGLLFFTSNGVWLQVACSGSCPLVFPRRICISTSCDVVRPFFPRPLIYLRANAKQMIRPALQPEFH